MDDKMIQFSIKKKQCSLTYPVSFHPIFFVSVNWWWWGGGGQFCKGSRSPPAKAPTREVLSDVCAHTFITFHQSQLFKCALTKSNKIKQHHPPPPPSVLLPCSTSSSILGTSRPPPCPARGFFFLVKGSFFCATVARQSATCPETVLTLTDAIQTNGTAGYL